MRKFLLAPIFALGLVFAAGQAQAAQKINVGISGSWYNAAKPGHGFAIEYTASPASCSDPEGCLIVYWFAYNLSGDPIFLLGTLPVNGNSAEGVLRHYSGQTFGNFTPVPDPAKWGTLRLTFSSCSAGTANYNASAAFSEYGSGNFPITRLAYVDGIECADAENVENIPASPLAGIWLGSLDSQAPGTINSTVSAVITGSGKAYILAFSLGDFLMTGQVNENNEVTLKAYPARGSDLPNGQNTGQATFNLDVNLVNRLEGTFTAPGAEGPATGTMALVSDPVYGRDATFDRIAGCWQLSVAPDPPSTGLLEISADGSITGELSSGCKWTGQVRPLGQGGLNLFKTTVQLQNCDFAGTYEGITWLDDFTVTDPDDFLGVRLHDNRSALIGGAARLDASFCEGN